jgi:hypothetical protein
MSWNFDYFTSGNNIFTKQGTNPQKNNQPTLLITETNRAILCTCCGNRVGDVAATFYEINQKTYCLKCGPKQQIPDARKEIPQETP